jgi:predicted DNA-binding transcriptional regulator AlpA
MAIRTTNILVKEILETTGLTDPEIDAFITRANLIVDQKLLGEGIVDAVLTEIETWITAHLIAITKERQAKQEKIGDVSATYAASPKGFFESTTYGQTALLLDTSGKLQAAALKKAYIKAIPQVPTGETLTNL